MKVKKVWFCRHCNHRLIKHINSMTKKVTYIHYNRIYYGMIAINHNHCSNCEISGMWCDKPEIEE